MSWNAGLSVGTSFVEFTALNPSQSGPNIHRRWYLPRLSLQDGLKTILNENRQIESLRLNVTAQTAEWVVDRRRGGPMAWLGTMGFESWPSLMVPPSEKSTTTAPMRPPPLIESDLMFGIAERTRADGQVERPVAHEDLEFLATKLELAKVKDIAVGFLHSVKNPANEALVSSYLRERGFSVYSSHAHPECTQEAQRWRLSMLDAYVAHEVEEVATRLNQLPGELPQIQTVRFARGSSAYLSQFELIRYLASAHHETLVLHLGLEQFAVIEPGATMVEWKTEFCPLTLNLPRFHRLKIQPTQNISAGGGRAPDFSARQSGYEPGPMVFGKALLPTFIDVLALIYGREALTPLEGLLSDKAEKRIQEVLFTAAKGFLKTPDIDSHKIAQALQQLALGQMAQDILAFTERKKILCTGAFARLLMPALQRMMPQYSWRLGEEFIESVAVARALDS